MNEHLFGLNSATKYDDGTSIMSEPKVDTDNSYPQCKAEKSNQLDPNFCKFGTCPYYDKFCDHTLQDKHGCAYLPHDTDSNLKYLEQTFTEFAKTQDDLIEEYDATLKTHGDTLEDYHERITINEGNIDAISSDVEDLQRKVYVIYKYFNSISPNVFFDICKGIEELAHKGSDFCGNCTHSRTIDGTCTCNIFNKTVDPDDSSCSIFEPPF